MAGPVNMKSAATTNATLVFGGPCRLRSFVFCNNAIYPVFVKFYDKATAPTVGTDTPVFKITVPAGASANLPGANISFDGAPIPFANGLGYAITTAIADSDATAVAADDLNGTLVWVNP